MTDTATLQPWWQTGVLDPQGPIAAAERTILFNATAIMLSVVIPVIVLTLAFAWWFRAGNKKAEYWPDWAYSGQVELVVWSIPTLVIIFLGGIAWIGSHQLDPFKPIASDVPALKIEVVSLDWKWLFIYPEQGLAAVNRLVVPAGTPLQFRLTSATVMNSFFVPQLGSQIYTMSGMATQLYLMADRPGSYPGISAQFSGDGFSDMRFNVEAMPKKAFEQWVTKTREAGGLLDAARYDELSRPSSAVAPMTFGEVAPNMFDTILHADMAMGDPRPGSSSRSAQGN